MSNNETNLEPKIKQFFKEIKEHVQKNHFNGQILVRLDYVDNEFVQLGIVDVSDNKHEGLYHRWLLDDGDDFVNLDVLNAAISEHILFSENEVAKRNKDKE